MLNSVNLFLATNFLMCEITTDFSRRCFHHAVRKWYFGNNRKSGEVGLN
jgi:hypothetical protein